MPNEIVVYITASSPEEAEEISRKLLEDRLIACSNIIPGVVSLFRWKGEICRENELLIIAKSRDELFNDIVGLVKKHHSYTVPEVIALPIIHGSEDYLRWLRETIGESAQGR
ncbi:MAG: divalent-cation tolerance protein CutA [Nitrospirota bacterium]